MCGYFVCVCVDAADWCLRSPEKALGTLDLELHMVLSLGVGAGYQAWVLCKSQYFLLKKKKIGKKMWFITPCILFSCKEEWNYDICRKIDGTREH